MPSTLERLLRSPWTAAACALLGVVVFVASAPHYFLVRGFPLDDAWIHAVYGRSLATDFTLSYDPGHPASGATSPAWAVVSAIAHLVSNDVTGTTKLLGLGLHLLGIFGVFLGFRRSGGLATATLGAFLVALDPDLVAGAVSGMELGLATAGIGALCAFATTSWKAAAVLGFVLPAIRPEFTGVVPVFVWLASSEERRARTIAATAGVAGHWAWLLARTKLATGLWLPATFHVKPTMGGASRIEGISRGFKELVPSLAGFAAWWLLAVLAAWLVVRAVRGERSGLGLAATVTGLLYLVVVFALVRPIDPETFYFQRYALPGIALVLAGLPSILPRPDVAAAISGLFALLFLVSTPDRATRLSNDARNIDEVQVAIGRALASEPPDHVVWTLDAGAVRYFGAPYVVDMAALNTPEFLDSRAFAYAAAHPPDLVVAFEKVTGPLPTARRFTTDDYTVMGDDAASTQVIATCAEMLGSPVARRLLPPGTRCPTR